MFLIDWYRQWKEIKREYTPEVKPCESCETLKMQLALAHETNNKLLERLLEKPIKEPERTQAPQLVASPTRMIPWTIRRQMLEQNDREAARAMREAAKPDSSSTTKPASSINEGLIDVSDLEAEMGIVEKEREATSHG